MTGYARHFVCGGRDFDRFWSEYLEEKRRVLFVFGLGFDPRSLDCLKKIKECNKKSELKYKSVEYDYVFGEAMSEMLRDNEEALARMGLSGLQRVSIPADAGDGNVTSTAACRILDAGDLEYSDIVVDVTSMPVGVYFPMIQSVLSMIRDGGRETRLYVTVSEDSGLDAKIKETSNSEHSSPMYKFGTSLEEQQQQDAYRVWIPILGRNQIDQLDKSQSRITPKDTVPVLPMPSLDPYSARDITTEYGKIFDNLEIEPRNIAYSDERHPSETCSKIISIARGYYELYEGAGGCIIVLSPMASKLLCVGCLMAACELLDAGKKIGVEYVPGKPHLDEKPEYGSTLFAIRLGEGYEW